MWTNTLKLIGRFKFEIMLLMPQTCVRMFERLFCHFATLGEGLLGVVRSLLQFCGILAIRETRRVKFSGTVNVLDVANTNLDSKYRVNKSLYD